jgi:hypothetical protein
VREIILVCWGTLLAPQTIMLGALALVVCLGAAGGVGWIAYLLYAPKLGRPSVRVPANLIVEPLFVAKKPPARPRGRLARGTGAVPNKPVRAESTEKIIRHAQP